MQSASLPAPVPYFGDKRKTRRWPVGIKGKIFVPERQYGEECLISDLSTAGAGLKTSCSAALGTKVVLYIDEFGRYDATIVQSYRRKVGVKFQISDNKRARTADLITNYVTHGTAGATSLRSSVRVTGVSSLKSFANESGEAAACKVLDIALTGASLETEARPEIGAQIFFGEIAARVVRHIPNGIAVAFVPRNELLPPLAS